MARRLEMLYRMITTREHRLTSRLKQARLGSYMEKEMRMAESCLRAALKIQEAGEKQRGWGQGTWSASGGMKFGVC